MSELPFDAVLMVGFGGPEHSEQIRPFLEHVLRGRPVPKSRIEEVAHHYEVIGGRSPFNEWTLLQRAVLELRLREQGTPLPVHVGMWHAPPFCEDVLRELTQQGARRFLVVIMAAFYDRVTVQRYTAVVDEAVRALALPDISVSYIRSPELQDGFYLAGAAQVREALERLPAEHRDAFRLMFTAHSVPTVMGQSSGYVASFENTAARIARDVGVTAYRCVYQSRSGAPTDSWLEPDVCDALREEVAAGTRAIVLAPIGFVCDHVEVLFDLDVEAADLAQTLAVPLLRAATVGTHPDYIDALANSVRDALRNTD